MTGAPPLTPAFHVAKEMPAALPDKAQHVLARCETHFEKHRETWIARRFSDLLAKEGAQPVLRPSWAPAEDRKAHLYKAATFMVDRKQQIRIQKIHAALRQSRGQDRGSDIGR